MMTDLLDGMVADNPDELIDLKVFHGRIIILTEILSSTKEQSL
jgi:hypothetical protein